MYLCLSNDSICCSWILNPLGPSGNSSNCFECPVLASLVFRSRERRWIWNVCPPTPPLIPCHGRREPHTNHLVSVSFLQTLKEWVAVESDSVQPVPRLRQELLRMMALAEERLRSLGAHVNAVNMGSQKVWWLPPTSELPFSWGGRLGASLMLDPNAPSS